MQIVLPKLALADLAVAFEDALRLLRGVRPEVRHPLSVLDVEVLADLFIALENPPSRACRRQLLHVVLDHVLRREQRRIAPDAYIELPGICTYNLAHLLSPSRAEDAISA